MKVFVTRGLLAVVVASMGTGGIASAAMIGFDFGTNSNGGFGLHNTSDSGQFIESLTIDFTSNNTFFDTTNDSPGANSTGFSINNNVGVGTVTLPDDSTTDGEQTATLIFNGFEPNDAATFNVDYDAFASPDSNGAPNGGLVSVLFSSGDTLNATIGTDDIFFAASVYSFSATASGTTSPAAVPEPSSLILLGLGSAGLFGCGRWRTRKRDAATA